MPAGISAYLNNGNALRLDEEDTIGTILTSFDALVAAYIYGAADIKALFYLDAIVEVQITDDAGAVIGTGFIGLVVVNGVNYPYHAAGRRFKGSLPVFDDADALITDYIALNDGGLNTLAKIAINSIPKKFANRIRINITALSSFYEASSTFGVEYKLTTGSIYTEFTWPEDPITAKESLITQIVLYTPFARFDIINIRPFINNPEGRKYGDVETITLEDLIYDIYTSLRSSACVATTDARVVYLKGAAFNAIQNGTITTNGQRLGFFAYKNEDFSIPADDGFYLDFNATDATKIYQINLSGEIISYTICAAPPAPTVYINITLSVNGQGRIVVNVASPISWSNDIVIVGTVQAYSGGVPDSRFTRSFSITIASGSTVGSQTLILIYDGAFTYEIINEGISPTSLDGKTLELTKTGI